MRAYAATCVPVGRCGALFVVAFAVADAVVVVGSAMRMVLKRSAAGDWQPARRLSVAVVWHCATDSVVHDAKVAFDAKCVEPNSL